MKLQEKPFECLRRMENGNHFEDDIVKNWYIARAYVLERLKGVALGSNLNEHLHVVILGDSPMMLSVVRQVALSAHYINYNEENEDESRRNRTVITLVSKNPDIRKELEKEEYLCNLPRYCKYVNIDSTIENENSYIDIEIQIVEDYCDEKQERYKYVFSGEDVETFCNTIKKAGIDIFSIDTCKAIYTSRMYNIGEVIENLPAEDIHCANRYALALNVYQYKKLQEPLSPMFKGNDQDPLYKVKELLSNVFCADCFESRYAEIKLCCNGVSERDSDVWERNNIALSKSEHARWVVEKLIMGYCPFDKQQHFMDECLFYDKKKRTQYRKNLKNTSMNPVHIDLCSYANMRRINPDDMKYDSFLMLAIPKILDKVNEKVPCQKNTEIEQSQNKHGGIIRKLPPKT